MFRCDGRSLVLINGSQVPKGVEDQLPDSVSAVVSQLFTSSEVIR